MQARPRSQFAYKGGTVSRHAQWCHDHCLVALATGLGFATAENIGSHGLILAFTGGGNWFFLGVMTRMIFYTSLHAMGAVSSCVNHVARDIEYGFVNRLHSWWIALWSPVLIDGCLNLCFVTALAIIFASWPQLEGRIIATITLGLSAGLLIILIVLLWK